MTHSERLANEGIQGRAIPLPKRRELECGGKHGRTAHDTRTVPHPGRTEEPGDRGIRNDDRAGSQWDRLQLVKYAEDLASIYQQEKARRKALEDVNEELKREIQARRLAEEAVSAAREDLEKKVLERTEELRKANGLLEMEIGLRREGEARIRKQLEEKDVLLSEIHHRVKNNLQIICSLLALQSSTISDEKMLAALSDSECRVRSMALIHEQLYRSKSLARIDMKEYIEALTAALTVACGKKEGTLSVRTDIDAEPLTVDSALPCGLIVNELITNCIKHAFSEGTTGEILTVFKKTPEDGYVLEVRDNGTGMPAGLDWRTASSLGLRLVKRLAECQLGGTVNVRSQDGTAVVICLPHLR